MHRFFKIFKLALASALMTLMFSCSASSLSGQTFVGATIVEVIVDSAKTLDTQVRGFGRRGFGMNFGGQGKSAATPLKSTPKNKATNTPNTQRRSDFWGFLGGLGMFSWLLMGVGLLGGGFLIYLLAMLLIPMIVGMIASSRKKALDDLPTSQYSQQDLFKDHSDQNKHQF